MQSYCKCRLECQNVEGLGYILNWETFEIYRVSVYELYLCCSVSLCKCSSHKIFQLQERNLTIHHQRSEMTNGELDDSFSASSMSGFSYRDSLESHGDASDEEPLSTITFGIAQSEAPGVSRDSFISIITRDIKQDANCPLLPKRKNYELKRELIRDMEIVGQGAFGLVAKAVLSHKNGLCTVAVKMLKGLLETMWMLCGLCFS